MTIFGNINNSTCISRNESGSSTSYGSICSRGDSSTKRNGVIIVVVLVVVVVKHHLKLIECLYLSFPLLFSLSQRIVTS